MSRFKVLHSVRRMLFEDCENMIGYTVGIDNAFCIHPLDFTIMCLSRHPYVHEQSMCMQVAVCCSSSSSSISSISSSSQCSRALVVIA